MYSVDTDKTKSKKKAVKSSKKEVQGLFKVIDNDDDDVESVTEEDIKELTEMAGLS